MRSWSQPTESTYQLDCSCEIKRVRALNLFPRTESDETGPYVAIALQYAD